VIGLAAGTIFRFWSYRRFVFRPVPRTEGYLGELASATAHRGG
jgi:hypothetical protein